MSSLDRRLWATLLVASVVLGACQSWNVNAPAPPLYEGTHVPNPRRARELADVITIGGPPGSAERSYQILVSRCQAAEREKSRDLIVYMSTRWSLLSTALISSSTAVALTAINEPNSSRFSPQTVSNLRISSIVMGSVGAVLSSIYGLVGFETRTDKKRKDLVGLRSALDQARAVWPYATPAERRMLLETMVTRCNVDEAFEREISRGLSGGARTLDKQIGTTLDLLKELEEDLKKDPKDAKLRNADAFSQWALQIAEGLRQISGSASIDPAQGELAQFAINAANTWQVLAGEKPNVKDNEPVRERIIQVIAKQQKELGELRDRLPKGEGPPSPTTLLPAGGVPLTGAAGTGNEVIDGSTRVRGR